ncbi:MAG: pantoate--beta-alanine ligase [Pirellulales bacterium]|nr:pantoate--beta-alanine ligase [Pirellulales bacterium]
MPHSPPTAAPRQPAVYRSGDVREAVLNARRAGQRVGLVPTMGSLHEGHLSLLRAARDECDLVIASIFVNPTQFGPQEDFLAYPRNFDGDLALLATTGCNMVFAPTEETMYGPNHSTFVEVGPVGQVLEGEFRPTHFRGVATVVLKLFELVPADVAYFGRKDYQQTIVLRRMIEDLNLPFKMRVCPTLREPDGLAMSSRNVYLSPHERRRALALFRSLRLAEQLARDGERQVQTIRQKMEREIAETGGIDLQYVAFVADGTVSPVEQIEGPTTVALAAKVGTTRLIDNLLIQPLTPNR